MKVNLPFLLCFTLYLRVIFQVQTPGGLYLEGRFNGGFLRYRFEGLIFGGAYAWRGLFSEFYSIQHKGTGLQLAFANLGGTATLTKTLQ